MRGQRTPSHMIAMTHTHTHTHNMTHKCKSYTYLHTPRARCSFIAVHCAAAATPSSLEVDSVNPSALCRRQSFLQIRLLSPHQSKQEHNLKRPAFLLFHIILHQSAAISAIFQSVDRFQKSLYFLCTYSYVKLTCLL